MLVKRVNRRDAFVIKLLTVRLRTQSVNCLISNIRLKRLKNLRCNCMIGKRLHRIQIFKRKMGKALGNKQPAIRRKSCQDGVGKRVGTRGQSACICVLNHEAPQTWLWAVARAREHSANRAFARCYVRRGVAEYCSCTAGTRVARFAFRLRADEGTEPPSTCCVRAPWH